MMANMPERLLTTNRVRAMGIKEAMCPDGKELTVLWLIKASTPNAANGLGLSKRLSTILVMIPLDKTKEINAKDIY